MCSTIVSAATGAPQMPNRPSGGTTWRMVFSKTVPKRNPAGRRRDVVPSMSA
jgi:hypothetical protein